MDCYEKGILSSQELGPVPCGWGDEQAALQWIERIVEKREVGEILSRGSFLAAKSLGKGVEQVPHFWGMDFPARDPRSSPDCALSRALFPMEWDYLQSLYPSRSISSGSVDLSEDGGTLKNVSGQEKLRVLADLNSLCPLVVARLPLVSASDIEGLFSAATGSEKGDEILTAAVMKTMEAEKILWQKSVSEQTGPDPLPLRLFKDREEKGRLESEIAKYRASKKLDDRSL
jgi:aldehyde:ferredoxin oxidoreductase